MLTYFFLILGFIFLVKGADLLVDGATSIAKRIGVSNLVIGLTIVAFGTSAPELILNIIASFQGSADLAVGNIIGANIANILLIGGVAAIIYPIRLKGGTIWKEIPLSLLAFVILFFIANDQLIDSSKISIISRAEGVVLIAFFLIFMYYTFGIAKVKERGGMDYEKIDTSTSIIYIILGCIALAIGGKWIIDGATVIATNFGISEALIGLTVLAVGTTLPELATAIVAALKKNADLAIGNIVGSNIFNIFFVLGISATIRPISFNTLLNTDIIIAVIATFFLFYFVFRGKKGERKVDHWEGVALVAIYIFYMIFIIWRG